MGRDFRVARVSWSLLGMLAVTILFSVGGASPVRHRVVRRPPIPPGLNSPRVRANIRAFRRHQAQLRSPASKQRRARSRTLYGIILRVSRSQVAWALGGGKPHRCDGQ